MTGTAPTPRDNYSQCLIDDRWFVHGGNDVFRELKNDTYQFNFHTGAWSVVSNVTRIACMPLNTHLAQFPAILEWQEQACEREPASNTAR